MKRGIILFSVVFFSAYMMSCKQARPVKTIENLKATYNVESTASDKYAKFAKKAKEEGYDAIAKMFEVISQSESIQARIFKQTLKKIGEKVEVPTIGTFEVKTTPKNLDDAIKSESYEITAYPEFIKAAELENCPEGRETFFQMLELEKHHKDFYQNALDSINTSGKKLLVGKWYVCPGCGSTFDERALKITKHPKDKLLKF